MIIEFLGAAARLRGETLYLYMNLAHKLFGIIAIKSSLLGQENKEFHFSNVFQFSVIFTADSSLLVCSDLTIHRALVVVVIFQINYHNNYAKCNILLLCRETHFKIWSNLLAIFEEFAKKQRIAVDVIRHSSKIEIRNFATKHMLA